MTHFDISTYREFSTWKSCLYMYGYNHSYQKIGHTSDVPSIEEAISLAKTALQKYIVDGLNGLVSKTEPLYYSTDSYEVFYKECGPFKLSLPVNGFLTCVVFDSAPSSVSLKELYSKTDHIYLPVKQSIDTMSELESVVYGYLIKTLEELCES